MPLPYDATVKDLARVNPRGLVRAFDGPTDLPVSLLNVDLSTVTTSADVVFGLGEPVREIVHLDFQSSASATKHADILVYNSLLHRAYHVPVHSIVILLRPQAAHVNLDGSVVYAARPRRGKMDFGYEVIRLWDRSAEDLLACVRCERGPICRSRIPTRKPGAGGGTRVRCSQTDCPVGA